MGNGKRSGGTINDSSSKPKKHSGLNLNAYYKLKAKGSSHQDDLQIKTNQDEGFCAPAQKDKKKSSKLGSKKDKSKKAKYNDSTKFNSNPKLVSNFNSTISTAANKNTSLQQPPQHNYQPAPLAPSPCDSGVSSVGNSPNPVGNYFTGNIKSPIPVANARCIDIPLTRIKDDDDSLTNTVSQNTKPTSDPRMNEKKRANAREIIRRAQCGNSAILRSPSLQSPNSSLSVLPPDLTKNLLLKIPDFARSDQTRFMFKRSCQINTQNSNILSDPFFSFLHEEMIPQILPTSTSSTITTATTAINENEVPPTPSSPPVMTSPKYEKIAINHAAYTALADRSSIKNI